MTLPLPRLLLALCLLFFATPLTACQHPPAPRINPELAAQCDHPAKPDLTGPRWDKALATYATEQSEVIDVCQRIINPLVAQ